MKYTIKQFKLFEECNEITVPIRSKILGVGIEEATQIPLIWIACREDEYKDKIIIITLCYNNNIIPLNYKYIGTVRSGSKWNIKDIHIFEDCEEE